MLLVKLKCLNGKNPRLLNTICVSCKLSGTTVKIVEKFIQTVCYPGRKEGSLNETNVRLYKKIKTKASSPYHPKKSRWCKLLTVSRRRPLSYRNQSIDLLCKSMYWFLYDNVLRLERVKRVHCQDFYPSRVDEIIISDIFAR